MAKGDEFAGRMHLEYLWEAYGFLLVVRLD